MILFLRLDLFLQLYVLQPILCCLINSKYYLDTWWASRLFHFISCTRKVDILIYEKVVEFHKCSIEQLFWTFHRIHKKTSPAESFFQKSCKLVEVWSKGVLEISQNSHESIFEGVSFSLKRAPTQVLSDEFCEILKSTFSYRHRWWLF